MIDVNLIILPKYWY